MGASNLVMPTDHLYQGDIGTHGVHIELIADSDNATATVPLTEVDAEARIVMLPGLQNNVGEQYAAAPRSRSSPPCSTERGLSTKGPARATCETRTQ